MKHTCAGCQQIKPEVDRSSDDSELHYCTDCWQQWEEDERRAKFREEQSAAWEFELMWRQYR